MSTIEELEAMLEGETDEQNPKMLVPPVSYWKKIIAEVRRRTQK